MEPCVSLYNLLFMAFSIFLIEIKSNCELHISYEYSTTSFGPCNPHPNLNCYYNALS